MRPRRFAALALAFALALALPPLAAAQGSFTKSVDDRAVFSRIVARLMHGDEPVTFDVVIACGVRTVGYRDGDRSVFTAFTPMLFGQLTKAGHVVAMRVPEICRGETTANGKVPKTFMPAFIWFDSAEDMRFGLGYFSEAAYENPKSQLKFIDATIQAATRAEWQDWSRGPGSANVIRQEWIDGRPAPPVPEEEMRRVGWNFRHDMHRGFFPTVCHAFMRLPLSEAGRALVREKWPADHPRFWQPGTEEARRNLIGQLQRFGTPATAYFEGRPLSAYGVDPFKRYGMPRRAGGARIIYPRAYEPPEIFPVKMDIGLPWLGPHLTASPVFYWEVDLNMSGFHYCYSDLIEAPAPNTLFDTDWPRLRRLKQFECRADGTEIRDVFDCAVGPTWFIEGDQYLYREYSFRR